MVGSAVPQPSNFPFPVSGVGPKPAHLITTAAALRFGDFLHHRFIRLRCHLGFLLQPAFKGKSPLGHVPVLKDLWHERALQFEGVNLLEWASRDAWSNCFYFFNGEETRNDFGGKGMSNLPMSRRGTFNRRRWTNILLAINVLVYMVQIATKGKLMLAGAKINSLIDKGELWRLITSSFLHANIGHLMVNCYSLNSVGPTVENISGPRRYLAVYITSAIASSATSYWLCKAPAVGASGAIFGLVGSFAVFILRHRNLVKDGNGDLHHILRVIFLNMVFGLMSKGIDNWGHLGGLVGGAATSWLLGPAWRYESPTNDGRRVFSDRAPIFSIINRKETSRWYR